MAAESGTGFGRGALDPTINYPAQSAGPAGLAGGPLLSAGHSGRRRHLRLAAGQRRTHTVLDRRCHRSWRFGRAPHHSGKAAVSSCEHRARRAGRVDESGEQRFSQHFRRTLVHDRDVRRARSRKRARQRSGRRPPTAVDSAERSANRLRQLDRATIRFA